MIHIELNHVNYVIHEMLIERTYKLKFRENKYAHWIGFVKVGEKMNKVKWINLTDL